MVAAKPILKAVWKAAKKHAPKILAATAIISETAAMIFMHKEAPIVAKKLEELPDDPTLFDKIKTAGPVYLPAILMILTSYGCIIGGTIIGESRATMLTSLCSASDMALAKYQHAAVEKLGEEKAKELEESYARKLMEENPPTPQNIIATGKGDQLIFDPLSGRYFTSDRVEVEKSAVRLNQAIFSEMWLSVNEWYDDLGLDPIGLGEEKGWNVDNLLEISWHAEGGAPGDRTCWVIGYVNPPVWYKETKY